MPADLHCHTRHSDGSLTVKELFLLAKLRGLSALAVTDHDTLGGLQEAEYWAKECGVELIPGIEISTVDSRRGRKAHVLGYLFRRPEALLELCRKTGESRRLAGEDSIRLVQKQYPVPVEMIRMRAQGSDSLYKQHIMHALLDAGYAKEFFGPLFRELFDSRTGTAYCSVRYPDVHEAVRLIHAAGGVAVLAHPGEYNSYELLEELAENGEIEGVEVWHPRNRAGDEEKFLATAKGHSLVTTGGTDFHGLYTSVPKPLGTCQTPEDSLRRLKKLAASK